MTDEELKYQKELEKKERLEQRQAELEKIRGLGFGAKLRYFWDYYKIVPILLACALFVVYIIFNMIKGFNTENLLYVCVLNSDTLDPNTEMLQEDYINARGGIKKNQQITFDSSIFVDPFSTGTSQMDVATTMKVTTYASAGAMDVFIGPSVVTAFEQKQGLLMNLENFLTKEEIQTLGEKGLLYYESEPVLETELPQIGETESWSPQLDWTEYTDDSLNTEKGNDLHPYAVRIDTAGVIGKYSIYADRQVWFSLLANSDHTEECRQFLKFLLTEESGEPKGTE